MSIRVVDIQQTIPNIVGKSKEQQIENTKVAESQVNLSQEVNKKIDNQSKKIKKLSEAEKLKLQKQKNKKQTQDDSNKQQNHHIDIKV